MCRDECLPFIQKVEHLSIPPPMCVVFDLINVQSVPVCNSPHLSPAQVRKEYGKCLRTHCCSGKSVETSISSSSKTTTSRTPGRYSTGSQVSLPACTPGRYSTADSQVRPEHAMRVLGYCCSLSTRINFGECRRVSVYFQADLKQLF